MDKRGERAAVEWCAALRNRRPVRPAWAMARQRGPAARRTAGAQTARVRPPLLEPMAFRARYVDGVRLTRLACASCSPTETSVGLTNDGSETLSAAAGDGHRRRRAAGLAKTDNRAAGARGAGVLGPKGRRGRAAAAAAKCVAAATLTLLSLSLSLYRLICLATPRRQTAAATAAAAAAARPVVAVWEGTVAVRSHYRVRVSYPVWVFGGKLPVPSGLHFKESSLPLGLAPLTAIDFRLDRSANHPVPPRISLESPSYAPPHVVPTAVSWWPRSQPAFVALAVG